MNRGRADRRSLALLTDLYELTMAYGFWKNRMVDTEAVFTLLFRSNPFRGGYAIACGLAAVVDFIEHFSFDPADIEYLSTLRGTDETPLFPDDFLQYLAELRLRVDVDAIPEGTVVFAREPLVRVRGPLIDAQIIESALLNMINFETLIATKASRVCFAARGEPVIEFGLRRAQGIDGALTASRAAYIGGCIATSNLLAGREYGIPVRGTHAHSWVMSFDSEIEAFRAYAEAMPNNCVFLVDTYDTVEGVRNAIEMGRWLRERGHEMIGVRLDSGDLAYLSIVARKMLDEAGFPDAIITASNELDEHIITSLKDQDATIAVWGVGTRLVTAFDHPALGGVYKMGMLRHPGEEWQYKVKLSEQAAKISTPGLLQIRRYSLDGEFVGDAIWDENGGVPPEALMIDPLDPTRRKRFPEEAEVSDLLIPIFRQGNRVYEVPDALEARSRAEEQLHRIHPGIKRFVNPHTYPVGLEPRLHDLRMRIIMDLRNATR